ncbi:MAG: helix-turn-helix transcriptional regulator [Candidatus Sedimenticola sp. (ex Thyasira tokunagai)]
MKIADLRALGAYIRAARKYKGMNQSQLAEELVVRQGTVSALESKTDTAKLRTLMHAIAILDLELHIVKKGETQELFEALKWPEKW